MKKPLVYVAGPVTNPVGAHWANMSNACREAEKVVAAGAVPIIPHLSIAWADDMIESELDGALCNHCRESGKPTPLSSECGCGLRPDPVFGIYDYPIWLDMCFEQIKRCDALFRMDGFSPGADKEVELAKKLGIPVFHHHGSLSKWIAEHWRA